MKKIGIIGTRRRDLFTDYKAVEEAFFEIYRDGDMIVTGGCPKGGDKFAEKIAKKNGIAILTFYPDWMLVLLGILLLLNILTLLLHV